MQLDPTAAGDQIPEKNRIVFARKDAQIARENAPDRSDSDAQICRANERLSRQKSDEKSTKNRTISSPKTAEIHHLSSAELQRGKWSDRTLSCYDSDWKEWLIWAEKNARLAEPASASDVADHLAELSRTRHHSTVARRLAGIAHHHYEAGLAFETRCDVIRATMRGIARTIGTAKTGKDAVSVDDIRAICQAIPPTLRGKRDRALILLGFAGAFRRSELVSIDLDQLEFVRDGVIVRLARSKTDQEGRGRLIAIAYGHRAATCPVRALKTWIAAAPLEDGPLFRPVEGGVALAGRYYAEGVANAVKRWARKAGLDPERFAGHSLRSGHVTEAAANGAQDRDIMATTGHRRVETMMGYLRRGQLFRNNSSAQLDL
jgi:integrase